VEIDGNAPAAARAELEIHAPPGVVWEVLTDVEGWPGWNPDVRSASLEGPLAPGTRFRWKAGPGTIVSTLDAVEPPRLIAWTGTTLGIRAIHVHRLEPHGQATLVVSEESWDGLLVRLLRGPLGKSLHGAIEGGLRHLKSEAERRAQAPVPTGPSGYD
jgi:hypothetical protein